MATVSVAKYLCGTRGSAGTYVQQTALACPLLFGCDGQDTVRVHLHLDLELDGASLGTLDVRHCELTNEGVVIGPLVLALIHLRTR